MNYTMNMSQKERIFLDSSVIIGLFLQPKKLLKLRVHWLQNINFFQTML